MRALLLALPILIAVAVGWFACRTAMARRNWSSQKRLNAAEDLIDSLRLQAAQHVALGDNFAAIVADEIAQLDRKELR